MAAIASDNVRRASQRRAFQHLVVIRICWDGSELTCDCDDSQKGEQVRQGFDALLGRKFQLTLKFFRELIEQFDTGGSFDLTRAGQLQALVGCPLPAIKTDSSRGALATNTIIDKLTALSHRAASGNPVRPVASSPAPP